MTVESKIKIYEIDGVETTINYHVITVKNHWNRKELVRLEIEGVKYTVEAADLERAIRNAQNAHR